MATVRVLVLFLCLGTAVASAGNPFKERNDVGGFSLKADDGWHDFAIEDVSGYKVRARVGQGFDSPLDVEIVAGDGTVFSKKRQYKLWAWRGKPGFPRIKVPLPPAYKPYSELDMEILVEQFAPGRLLRFSFTRSQNFNRWRAKRVPLLEYCRGYAMAGDVNSEKLLVGKAKLDGFVEPIVAMTELGCELGNKLTVSSLRWADGRFEIRRWVDSKTTLEDEEGYIAVDRHAKRWWRLFATSSVAMSQAAQAVLLPGGYVAFFRKSSVTSDFNVVRLTSKGFELLPLPRKAMVRHHKKLLHSLEAGRHSCMVPAGIGMERGWFSTKLRLEFWLVDKRRVHCTAYFVKGGALVEKRRLE